MKLSTTLWTNISEHPNIGASQVGEGAREWLARGPGVE